MIIYGVPLKELEKIAIELDLRLYEPRPEKNTKRFWVRFQIRTKYGSKRYQKRVKTTKWDFDKKKWIVKTKSTASVCRHGVYDFLEKVFQAFPEATSESSVTNYHESRKIVYRGVDSFYELANRDHDYYGELNNTNSPYYKTESVCDCA